MDRQNLTLLTDLYELTMMQGYFRHKDQNEIVIFDAFYRSNPCDGGYAISAFLLILRLLFFLYPLIFVFYGVIRGAFKYKILYCELVYIIDNYWFCLLVEITKCSRFVQY